MAYLYPKEVGEDSATLCLMGLDTSWAQGVRAPHYYIRAGSAVSVNSSTHDPYSSGYDKYKMGAYIYNGASYGGDVTFTGLSANTTYYAYCVVKYSKNGTATYLASFTNSFTTNAASVDPSISDVSHSASGLKVTFEVDVYNPSAKTYYVSIWNGSTRLASSGPWTNTGTTTKTLSYTFSSYTSYSLTVYVGTSASSSSAYDSMSYRLTLTSSRHYFSWASDSLLTSKPSSNSPISSGDKISTYLTATRWNNLQTVINELRKLKSYSTYSFSSSAVTGNKLTAGMYNECVYAITAMSGAASSNYTVSSGDTVTATKINWLQSAVNSLSV